MYLIIEIQKSNDGTLAHIESVHATMGEAEQRYHTILAAAAVSAVNVHSAVMLDDMGNRIKGETYYHGGIE